MTEPAPPPDTPPAHPVMEWATMPTLGRAMSILAGALGAMSLAGAVIAVVSQDAQSYLLEGPLEWWAKAVAIMAFTESVVGFVAIGALIIDRTRMRVVAALGLIAWAIARVLFAVDQLQVYDRWT